MLVLSLFVNRIRKKQFILKGNSGWNSDVPSAFDQLCKQYYSMHLKIIVSSADESKAALDPSVSIMKGSVESKFPVIDENSIDTCIDLEDGQTVMFGGLISSAELPTRFGIEGLKLFAAAKCSKNEEQRGKIRIEKSFK